MKNPDIARKILEANSIEIVIKCRAFTGESARLNRVSIV